MKDRVWFISGVSRGVGRAIASAAIEAGERVVGTVRDDGVDLPRGAGSLHTFRLDVADRDAIERVVAEAFALYGRIDVIVNNAAYPLFGALEEAGDDQVRRIFDVNVHGPRRVVQAVLPRLRRQGSGHVVTISSVAGYAPTTGYGYYAMTKAAVEAFNEVLADEVAPWGIKVTSVVPGAFRTGFVTPRSVEETRSTIPGYDRTRQNIDGFRANSGNQIGDPDRLARIVLKLADEAEPPRRLVLGSDALARARGHAEALLAEMAANEERSLLTDFARN